MADPESIDELKKKLTEAEKDKGKQGNTIRQLKDQLAKAKREAKPVAKTAGRFSEILSGLWNAARSRFRFGGGGKPPTGGGAPADGGKARPFEPELAHLAGAREYLMLLGAFALIATAVWVPGSGPIFLACRTAVIIAAGLTAFFVGYIPTIGGRLVRRTIISVIAVTAFSLVGMIFFLPTFAVIYRTALMIFFFWGIVGILDASVFEVSPNHYAILIRQNEVTKYLLAEGAQYLLLPFGFDRVASFGTGLNKKQGEVGVQIAGRVGAKIPFFYQYRADRENWRTEGEGDDMTYVNIYYRNVAEEGVEAPERQIEDAIQRTALEAAKSCNTVEEFNDNIDLMILMLRYAMETNANPHGDESDDVAFRWKNHLPDPPADPKERLHWYGENSKVLKKAFTGLRETRGTIENDLGIVFGGNGVGFDSIPLPASIQKALQAKEVAKHYKEAADVLKDEDLPRYDRVSGQATVTRVIVDGAKTVLGQDILGAVGLNQSKIPAKEAKDKEGGE